MPPCFCGILLGVLVIVFAWWDVSWGNIALTVLGALMALKALGGTCCCKTMCKKQEENSQPEQTS